MVQTTSLTPMLKKFDLENEKKKKHPLLHLFCHANNNVLPWVYFPLPPFTATFYCLLCYMQLQKLVGCQPVVLK